MSRPQVHFASGRVTKLVRRPHHQYLMVVTLFQQEWRFKLFNPCGLAVGDSVAVSIRKILPSDSPRVKPDGEMAFHRERRK